ncbi:MAG: hypothetical protein HY277_07925 [Ignavibacteriales bacterium]|nr:hypothetical protein [Ignavibacteriales bacterium]
MKSSKDLPESFKSLQSYVLSVNQTIDSMVMQPEMTGAGQKFKLPPTIYKFDGSEVYREDKERGSQRWIKSGWTTTGQKLIVTNRVIQKQGISEHHYTQTDVWQFGKKNTLMILVTQKFEKNDSTHTERRYYHRVP